MPKINYLPPVFTRQSSAYGSDGFSHIFVLLSFLAVLGAVGFFMRPSSSTHDTAVLGTAQSASTKTTRNGFSVVVSSSSGNWDFFEYLCTSYEECNKSLTSGFQLSTISGGQTDGYEIFVEPTREWDAYKFIKYYVKSGWDLSSANFLPTMTQTVQGAEVHTFEDGAVTSVVAPITPFKTDFYTATSFSDN